MVRVEGRGMSNRTLLWRSVVAYPIVIRDFIANTHIHTYAHTRTHTHLISDTMLALVGRFCLDVHIKVSWDSTGVCVKYHTLSSSLPASDVLNELGRFSYYMYAVMIVKDSVTDFLMEKDT